MKPDNDHTWSEQKNKLQAEVEKGCSDKIKVGLVEDQFLFRKGIKAILSEWTDIDVMFESSDGYSVIQKLKESTEIPDVMLVDLSLPPEGKKEFSGLDVTNALKDAFPEMKILILSVYEEDHFIAKVIKMGAHGYLVKDSSPQEVYDAIATVHARGIYINERTLNAIQNNAHKKSSVKVAGNKINNIVLTKREEEILLLICKQKTTDEIAEDLFISPKTVNGHRNNLLQKTGSRNVVGLVAFALTRE